MNIDYHTPKIIQMGMYILLSCQNLNRTMAHAILYWSNNSLKNISNNIIKKNIFLFKLLNLSNR